MTIMNSIKLAESALKGQETLWEKVKLLITSNFSFSHSVFERLVLQTNKNQGLCGKELTLYQTILIFNYPKEEGFGKCGKRTKCWYPAFSPFTTVFSWVS